ncbi:uncharacterized protein B0I36DRAFT_335491 [Microdochium trichocladiopsis]|uniref:Uncharacterized protein n=1 Tax=Microdochium trichocladiopsis TaxID=1682393 RepID=A0A9P8XU70_9PEZI|nr:uncharacterized protein B0I36DRAFT_335491 [Microdochium trichocladiopsis]KAH7018204.1 hypothetical protein B0I36DRAFT_335491 [Microdochium trichocladiopsis]
MASSGDTDAQTWVFPPPGVDVPPIAATGDFGPVHYGDSMILDWDAPTAPVVIFSCFSQLQNNSNYYAVRDKRPPITYTFDQTAIQQSAFDLTFCHFYFSPSKHGNTIVFQYDNKPLAKPVTWSAGSVSSSATSSSGVSSTASSTASSSSSAAATSATSDLPAISASNTPPANPTGGASAVADSGSTGLPAGTSAGIGVGVALGVLLVAGVAGFLLWRRRRKTQRQQQQQSTDSNGPFEVPSGGMQQYDGTSTTTYYSPEQHHQHHYAVAKSPGAYQDSVPPTAELHSGYQPSELHSGHRPTELP